MRIIRHRKLSSPKKTENQYIHKDINQLESVYQKQYQNRFQKLEPKLEHLSFAREKDKEDLIPIIKSSSSFLKNIIETINSQ